MEFRFADPARDFGDGIEVLHRYHEAFRALGEDLVRLAREIREQGMDETRANRCVELHCFFLRANALHHRDEEKAIFPLLLGRSQLVDGMVERLTLDHEEIEEAWTALARHLARPEQLADPSRLLETAREFEKLQREHLQREDEDFLPKIAALLSDRERRRSGAIMAEMRGLGAHVAGGRQGPEALPEAARSIENG